MIYNKTLEKEVDYKTMIDNTYNEEYRWDR
jgi:hypothetical protein